MNEKDFMLKIKEILDNEDVTMDSVLADLEEWDSLSIITFAAFGEYTARQESPSRSYQGLREDPRSVHHAAE